MAVGVRFGVADSSNLISAMRNNVTTANAIVDRLATGSRYLVAQLDAGVLQGAAYTAGRGLFSELIIPGIVKLGEAVDDVQAELASYEHAHSVVAEHGDLDHNDLTQGLRDAKEKLCLIEEQLERNASFLTQLQALVTGDVANLAYQDHILKKLRAQVENEIRQYKDKIARLEWFVADVSNYFSDSLQVMQLAAQAAIEQGKVAVESDGSYYTDGVDLAVIQALRDAKITTRGGSSFPKSGHADLYDNLDFASGLSYDKLVEWMRSSDSQTIAEVARRNPGRFRDLLNNAIDIYGGNWWSALAALANLSGFDGGETAAAASLMYHKFRTGEEWDMKIHLAEAYERSFEDGYFYVRDAQGRETRSDVFGNVNYGIMLAHYGVPLDVALRAANAKGATGIGDDPLDDRAVEFGYKLYLDHLGGLTGEQYYEAIANAKLTDR